ncbi:hypothetical protein [Amycolatopsis sp. H20-H5]|uniref:hypothetical protein n=1 Tax=Amycolatopsis sp. H20-H5 TaxID=3046309 RepID=UPI002DB7C38F|nr:hypothetical protein [Amycolatopsis sp. H20-H5]MEC3975940.1 hypothetical protein [Amycolatopsis sp. H20-H5]
MWRLGFVFWRAWLYGKYAVPALLVLWLIHAAQGYSRLFWVALVVFALIGFGLVLGISEFRNREFGKPGRERVR